MLPLPDLLLAERVARQGGPASAEELRDLMAGIAASDTPAEDTAWQELLTTQTALPVGDAAALTSYIAELRATLADRLYRVGRCGGGVARSGGYVRGRSLHPSGRRAGEWGGFQLSRQCARAGR